MSVVIEQLRISDNGQRLYIDAHVNKASYFDNLNLSKITICTEDQVSEAHPDTYGEKYIWQGTIEHLVSDDNYREVHLMLTKSDFDEAFLNGEQSIPDATKPVANEEFKNTDLSKNMFFVYFETEGTPDPCTPCDMDGMVLGVTFDYGALYNPAMNYTRQLADDCNIPSEFIDYILNVDALKLSLETEHYIPAIEYWKRLIGSGSTAYPYRSTKTCGCHG